MKLTFKTAYNSITTFSEIDNLPKFTLITGVNGTGKTHLLKAISEGHVLTDIAPKFKEESKFFDWATLVPNNIGNATITSIHSQKKKLLDAISKSRTQHQPSLLSLINEYKLQQYKENPWKLCTLSKEELDTLLHTSSNSVSNASQLYDRLGKIVDTVFNTVKPSVDNKDDVQRLYAHKQRNFVLLSEDNLENKPFERRTPELFKESCAQMFLQYFELCKLNKLHKLDRDEGRNIGNFLTDKEFLDKYGEPPWNFVNQVLKEAKLDFEISYPISYTTVDFTPILTKISTGVELNFSSLSSGEKVLMSFALCLYYSQDKRQLIEKPKLLLFDEIDAPLHPSMSRHLINVITNTLVKKHDIHVIMTTHSPTTVAVAPEDSVYVMKPLEPGLHKTSRNQAIAILTAEIPTLSIDFSGRRQVFVESANDAKYYDAIYKNLRLTLNSELSLQFIPVSTSNPKGEDNAGCDRVKSTVKALANNKNVFGLIDWDTKNNPDPNNRIVVLAYGRRYAIENCLLDPLLVAALVIREDKDDKVKEEFGLKDLENYKSLENFSSERLQEFVDKVQKKILDDDVNTIEVKYKGGFTLNIATNYLQMQGHELEDKIKEAYPFLKSFQNNGRLLLYIANTFLKENLAFLPMELEECFYNLLSINSE